MLDDRERLEALQQMIETRLPASLMGEGRAAYLSNHENVLRDLPSATAQDWELAQATMVHLAPEYVPEHNLYGEFRSDILEHVQRLVAKTSANRPVLNLAWNESRVRHPFDPYWSTYIFARVSMAVLAEQSDPEYAVQLYESISTLFPPFVSDEITGVPFLLAPALVRPRLAVLYERVGRCEEALSLLIPGVRDIGGLPSSTEQFRPVLRNFNGWLDQLLQSVGVVETKRYLDLIYRLIQTVHGIDQEEREELRDCHPDTKQFWAWYYGWALGQLIGNKPDMRSSLLEELDAGEWDDGWPAGGVIMGSHPDSWEEYRQWALRLYQMADIEYSQTAAYPGFRMHWGARQPPHLSAQSDLYWAMRVGFADAHLELGQETPLSLRDIAARLDHVQSVVSSSALHTLRVEHGVDQIQADIQRGLPPTNEYWKQELEELFSDTWKILPEATKEHLVNASAKKYAQDGGGQRIALAQAIESLFLELIEPRLRDLPEYRELLLKVPRGTMKPRSFGLGQWHLVQLSGWARILATAGADRLNASFGSLLRSVFPGIEGSLWDHSKDLQRISELRGDASHHSSRSIDDHARDAEDLWNLVVDGIGRAGFITRFCKALGLVDMNPPSATS